MASAQSQAWEDLGSVELRNAVSNKNKKLYKVIELCLNSGIKLYQQDLTYVKTV